MNIIKNSYDGFKCRVKSEGVLGDTFDVRAGVRLGDVWSPFLIGIVINYVLANSVRGGIDIGQNVADLDFADDITLVGKCDPDVECTKREDPVANTDDQTPLIILPVDRSEQVFHLSELLSQCMKAERNINKFLQS